MPSPDNELWQRCWRERQTPFHQTRFNPQLMRFWTGLGLAPQAPVFVPLCGKSLDMLWLAGQGHPVLGVELSPIAVRAFFKENRLRPVRRPLGAFTLWQSGGIRILCGDFFELRPEHLAQVAAVYDRASLTALPPELRAAYARHLRDILPAAARILLLTTEEALAGETGYQADGVDGEIVGLYVGAYDIRLRHVDSELEMDLSGLAPARIEHKVYCLTPRAA